MTISPRSLPIAAACLGLSLSACGAGATPTTPALTYVASARPAADATAGKIKHIVIVVQENRSFNNLFEGYPGATTASYGYDSHGDKIDLTPVPLEANWDVEHDSIGFFAACNGTGRTPGTHCAMNGFNNEWTGCEGSGCSYAHPQYAYVPRRETKPYFEMARQYVLADQMYASNFDASSFVSHQYIIAGQAEAAVNYPLTLWGCPGGPYDTVTEVGPHRQIPHGSETVCWDPTTLGDELDAAHVSWAFYATTYMHQNPGLWSAYQAIKHIYDGPDWSKDVISPPSRFLKDVRHGKLRAVSWVTPTAANSDHAGSESNTGPSWVASIVNTIGQSKYWDSTAVFIFWDDYGGWYDPEPPAYKDYDGLGVRVPMLVISAYARHGKVVHEEYEHGSILKFVEDRFGLGRLAASDRRANSPASACFDFTKPPRRFKIIHAQYDDAYFLHQPPDFRAPDDN